jgi:hypothetical protein
LCQVRSAQAHLLEQDLGSAKETAGHMAAARHLVDELERQVQEARDGTVDGI